MQNLLAEQATNTDPNTRIHILWYFVDCRLKSFNEGEKKFHKLNFENIPVLVVLQNEDKLKDSIRDNEVDLVDDEPGAPPSAAIQHQILDLFNSKVDGLKSQLTDLPVQKFVHARTSTPPPPHPLAHTDRAQAPRRRRTC